MHDGFPVSARWAVVAEPLAVGAFGTLPGDVLRPKAELFAEILLRTRDFGNGCAIWVGGEHRKRLDQRGSIRVAHRFREDGSKETICRVVTRVIWELLFGPTDLVIDHICMNQGCVNPQHLEPVTLEENSRRKTGMHLRCRNGHEYKGVNDLYVRVGESISRLRRCALCEVDVFGRRVSHSTHEALRANAVSLPEAQEAVAVLKAEAEAKVAFFHWWRSRSKGDDECPPVVWDSFVEWAENSSDMPLPAAEPANDWSGATRDLWQAFLDAWCHEAERHDIDPIVWGYCWSQRRGWYR